MNERKTFSTEKDALDYARKIAELIEKRGAQPQITKEKAAMADAYLTLADKLKPHGKTPEDAVEHYIKFLGNEIIRQALPPISELADKWQAFKFTDTTLSKPMVRDVRSQWDSDPDSLVGEVDAKLERPRKKKPGKRGRR